MTTASPREPSIDIVRRIQSGDDSAWEALYHRYRDQLLLSIRCRLGPGLRSHMQSEDILHSVFKDALSDLHRFEPEHAYSVNRYLHVCVLNKIRSKAEYYGAQKRQGEVPLSDSIAERVAHGADGEPQYADAARYTKLEAALELLPDDAREVILLRRVEELPNTEVARILGKSPAATSKIYTRALARLAVALRRASV